MVLTNLTKEETYLVLMSDEDAPVAIIKSALGEDIGEKIKRAIRDYNQMEVLSIHDFESKISAFMVTVGEFGDIHNEYYKLIAANVY